MAQIEIERRWLLRYSPTGITPNEIIVIEQWYREGDAGVVRYRKSSSSNAPGVRYEKIIKYNTAPGVNSEETIPVTPENFAIEVEPTMKYIKKVRRVYHFKDFKFEVDDFANIKLVICEVELPTVEWLNKELEFHPNLFPLIVKEITGDKAFSNFALAKEQYK